MPCDKNISSMLSYQDVNENNFIISHANIFASQDFLLLETTESSEN